MASGERRIGNTFESVSDYCHMTYLFGILIKSCTIYSVPERIIKKMFPGEKIN